MEEENRELEKKETGGKHDYRWLKLIAALAVMLISAAVLLLVLAWFAFHMRLSAEVTGVLLWSVYIIPSMFGGWLLSKAGLANGRKPVKSMLLGCVAGIAFYGALLVATGVYTGWEGLTAVRWEILLVNLASGMAGACPGGAKHRKSVINE